MKIAQNVFFGISTASLGLLAFNAAALLGKTYLDPQADIELAGQCELTRDDGRKIIYHNRGPWDAQRTDAELIRTPDVKSAFDRCADRLEHNDGAGIFTVRRRYWDIVDNGNGRDAIPNGAVPVEYAEDGSTRLSVQYLVNKWDVANAVSQIRKMGQDTNEISARYRTQTASWDNARTQLSDRLKSYSPLSWMSGS